MFADGEAQPITPDAIRLTLYCWLAVAIVGGMVVASIWRGKFALGEAFFPPQRVRAVPWGFLGFFGSFCLSQLWIWLFADLFKALGTASTEQVEPAKEPLPIWAQVLALPFFLASTVYFLRQTVNVQLYQLGLTLHRWRKDVVAGYGAFAVITPVTFAVFFAATVALRALGDEPAAVHTLEKTLRDDPSVSNWLGAILVTILVAPIMEEILFRGLLQPWLVQVPFAADVAILLSLVCAVSIGLTRELRYDKIATWWPLIFLVVVGPAYLGFERLANRWLSRPGAGRAIFVSSFLFAASHAVWPTPIPLFFLGLALGWLGYRTQSIIGCMVCHGMFNAVTMLELVLTQ